MLRNIFYWILGLGILLANKARYTLRGYRTPRPFKVTDTDAVMAYDREVVDRWEEHLRRYGVSDAFRGKRVIELGPGADLGVGLLALARGAGSYSAIDANDLIAQAPPSLYDAFFSGMPETSAAELREELGRFMKGDSARIRFVLDPSFAFVDIPSASQDLIVSNAAFEHFADIPSVARHMARIAAPGAVLCAHVDLQTHTRVIRDRDPLNIYRFSRPLYRALRFSGIPNRVRPHEYIAALKNAGWQDIMTVPVTEIQPKDFPRLSSGLARRFAREGGTLRVLSFMLLARRQ